MIIAMFSIIKLDNPEVQQVLYLLGSNPSSNYVFMVTINISDFREGFEKVLHSYIVINKDDTNKFGIDTDLRLAAIKCFNNVN